MSICTDDLDYTPFVERGGIGKAFEVFGDKLGPLLDEMNEALRSVTKLASGRAVASLEDLAAPIPRSITDGPFGSNLKTEHYTADGPRVVRLQNIGEGRFCDDRSHISEERYQRLHAHDVQPGDVLVAALGEVLPRACIAPSWLGPAIVKADCFRFRLRSDVNPQFVVANAQQSPDSLPWPVRKSLVLEDHA